MGKRIFFDRDLEIIHTFLEQHKGRWRHPCDELYDELLQILNEERSRAASEPTTLFTKSQLVSGLINFSRRDCKKEGTKVADLLFDGPDACEWPRKTDEASRSALVGSASTTDVRSTQRGTPWRRTTSTTQGSESSFTSSKVTDTSGNEGGISTRGLSPSSADATQPHDDRLNTSLVGFSSLPELERALEYRQVSASLTNEEVQQRMDQIWQRSWRAFDGLVSDFSLERLNMTRLSENARNLAAVLVKASYKDAAKRLENLHVLQGIEARAIMMGFFAASIFKWVFQRFDDSHDVSQEKDLEVIFGIIQPRDKLSFEAAIRIIRWERLEKREKDEPTLNGHAKRLTADLISVIKCVIDSAVRTSVESGSEVDAKMQRFENTLEEAFYNALKLRIQLAMGRLRYTFWLPKTETQFKENAMAWAAEIATGTPEWINLCVMPGISSRAISHSDESTEAVQSRASAV